MIYLGRRVPGCGRPRRRQSVFGLKVAISCTLRHRGLQLAQRLLKLRLCDRRVVELRLPREDRDALPLTVLAMIAAG